jgi:hypothetical protein
MKNVNIGGEAINIPDSAFVAAAPVSYTIGTFNDLVSKAMDNPLDREPLGRWNFRGKKVAVI